MNYETFERALCIYHELCYLIEEDHLSEDCQFNRQLKKDFEQLHEYFDRLTDSQKIKLEDFVY